VGQITEVRFEDLMPGELDFHPRGLRNFIMNEKKGQLSLPTPVRSSTIFPNMYVTLDGRNRMIGGMMKGLKTTPVFVTSSVRDVMEHKQFSKFPYFLLSISNASICNNWAYADDVAKMSGAENYRQYFQILLRRYPYIGSTQSFLEHLSKLPEKTRYDLM